MREALSTPPFTQDTLPHTESVEVWIRSHYSDSAPLEGLLIEVKMALGLLCCIGTVEVLIPSLVLF